MTPLVTALATPVPQRLALGATSEGIPLALPHTPFTGPAEATKAAVTVQFAATIPVVKLLTPRPVVEPPQPEMLWVSKPEAGAAVQVVVLPPLTGLTQLSAPFAPAVAVTVYWCGAAQLAVVPPLAPTQVQVKLLVPVDTADAAPKLHRLALGATSEATPLADPQAPFCGTSTAVNVALTVQSATTVPVL